jgi:hypothetical protein
MAVAYLRLADQAERSQNLVVEAGDVLARKAIQNPSPKLSVRFYQYLTNRNV